MEALACSVPTSDSCLSFSWCEALSGGRLTKHHFASILQAGQCIGTCMRIAHKPRSSGQAQALARADTTGRTSISTFTVRRGCGQEPWCSLLAHSSHQLAARGIRKRSRRPFVISAGPTDALIAPPEPKLRVKNLHRTARNGDIILEGITMSAQPSNLLALIGPSGSGKSTVLRALNRLWEPPPGSVFLDGLDVTKMDVVALRVRVGMVFQKSNLFDGTVATNVRYGPALRKRHLSSEKVDSLLLRAGIDPGNNFQSKSANELSGGEAQRVSIARALANAPEILLLDEPTSSLDPLSVRKVEETILHLKEEKGLTLVLVSHSMDQVLRVADTAALLSKGRVIEIGTPQELQESSNPEVSMFFSGELD